MTDEPDEPMEAELVDVDDDDEVHYAMPFVVTSDAGGPFDVEAYTAGWEMGILAGRLSAAQFHGLGLPHVSVMRGNLPQVDLIAMAHGCRAVEIPWSPETDETIRTDWAHVGFEWGTMLPDGVTAPE